MFDKLMDRLLESATSACMPKLEEMAELRKAELLQVREKNRSDPTEVEAWFDREIEKLDRVDVKDLLNKIS